MSESAKPLNMLNSLAFPILEDNGHLFHKSPGGIVDEGIFKKSTEDEEDADARPDVDRLGVRHWGQTPLDRAHGGGHGQQGGHPQGHPGWHRLVVQPEGEPGHQHDHEARDVDGRDVERQLSRKDQVHFETTVLPWQCKGLETSRSPIFGESFSYKAAA